LFKSQAGLFVVHIPYKGTALAMPDLISGKVDVLFDSLPTGLPHVKDGRLRALGVTSAQRTSMAPGLPAIAEVLPGYESTTWFGLFGPQGMRPEIVARVNTAALQADENRNRQIVERIPAGRWGKAEDIGGAAVFLASSAADYVNGHILAVDGGWLAR
jgi:tripartite-type tricarboxylate transporter receptor subunit TctC